MPSRYAAKETKFRDSNLLKGMNKILDSKKSKYIKVIEEKLVEKIK